MDFNQVGPVARTENTLSMRRQQNSNQHRRPAPSQLPEDDSETGPFAETGMITFEEHDYVPASDEQSAILRQIAPSALLRPGWVAAQAMQLREETNGHHG